MSNVPHTLSRPRVKFLPCASDDRRHDGAQPRTQYDAVLSEAVHYLARYFHRSPEQLSPEDIREYQLYLAQDRKVSVNSRLVAMTALRFLYGVTLRRERFVEMLPMPRKEHYLPVILSPAEVLRFLEAAPSYPQRVIFSTMYGTGMRVSEALHLRMRHIDSQRMMIRMEQGKGNRDRDVICRRS
jgi:integrase/recombinase XerD